MPGSYKGHAFDVWIFGLRNPGQQYEVLRCALSASGHGSAAGQVEVCWVGKWTRTRHYGLGTVGVRYWRQNGSQTWSLVSRSHQRWGRINVPSAAMAQMVARSRKLAMRKNPPFISCIERGTIISPSHGLIVPLQSVCHPQPQRHDSSGDFLRRRDEHWGQGRIQTWEPVSHLACKV